MSPPRILDRAELRGLAWQGAVAAVAGPQIGAAFDLDLCIAVGRAPSPQWSDVYRAELARRAHLEADPDPYPPGFFAPRTIRECCLTFADDCHACGCPEARR